MSTPQAILDSGELHKFWAAAKAVKLGTLLAGPRLVQEVVPVVANVATPTYTVQALMQSEVTLGAGGNGVKTPILGRGATVAATQATVAANGLTVNFFGGEVTGAAAVALVSMPRMRACGRSERRMTA